MCEPLVEVSAATCEECGNADFNLQDGYFFCSVCQTQSQDIREEKTGEDYIASGQQKLCIRTNVQKKEKLKENAGQTLAWTTNDGFNIILRKMVDILMKMGVSSQLKDVIKQLWFVYLKKTQHAFCPTFSTKGWTPKLPTLPRERDVQVLINGSASITAKKYRQTYLHKMRNRIARLKLKAATSLRSLATPTKRRKKAMNTTGGDTEVDDINDSNLNTPVNVDEALSLDDFDITAAHKHEVTAASSKIDKRKSVGQSIKQDPQPVQDKRSDRKKVYSKKNYSQAALKLKTKSIRTQKESVTRMSMSRVLEFLYLGLLLVDDYILLCDLLRWIRESWLPLREAAYLLPQNFDFQTYDTMTFRLLDLPDNKIIRSKTAKLAAFLDLQLDRMPKKSVQEIASRFILDLKLPREFHQLVHNLALVHPNQFSMSPTSAKDDNKVFSIPNYEGRALAFIIVILKLLFGINGKSEKKQDKFSHQLSDILPDVKPFLWEDWKNYIMYRHRLLKRNFVSETWEQPENCTNIDQLIGYYIENELKARGKMSAGRLKRYRTSKEHILEMVRHPLKSVATMRPMYSLQGTAPTSFPYSSKERKLAAESSDLQESNLRTEDFRKATVQHLIHPERFRTEIENNGGILEIKKSVWKSSSLKSNPISKSRADLSRQSLSSPIQSDLMSGKRQRKTITTVKDKEVKKCKEQLIWQEKVNTKDKKEEAITEIKTVGNEDSYRSSSRASVQNLCVYQPYQEYSVYHYKRNEHNNFHKLSSNFPSSLVWLVDVLSNVGGMKAATLYEEVMLVERVLVHSNLSQGLHNHLVDTLW